MRIAFEDEGAAAYIEIKETYKAWDRHIAQLERFADTGMILLDEREEGVCLVGMPRSYRPEISERSHVIGLRVRGGGALLHLRGLRVSPPPDVPCTPSRPRVADLREFTSCCCDPAFKLIFCTLKFSETHSGWIVKYCLRGERILLKNGVSVPGRAGFTGLASTERDVGPFIMFFLLLLSMLTRSLLLVGSPMDIRDVGNSCRERLKHTEGKTILVKYKQWVNICIANINLRWQHYHISLCQCPVYIDYATILNICKDVQCHRCEERTRSLLSQHTKPYSIHRWYSDCLQCKTMMLSRHTNHNATRSRKVNMCSAYWNDVLYNCKGISNVNNIKMTT